jgi:integrase
LAITSRNGCAKGASVRTGAFFFDSEDRIIEASDGVLEAMGDVRGRFRWSLVTLACGRQATAEDARAIHATTRALGKLVVGGYTMRGPRGTIYVDRAEWHAISGGNLVKRVRFCLIAAGDCGRVMGGQSGVPPMPHTELPAVHGEARLRREIEIWERRMPGEGFTPKQIRKRVTSAKECLRQIDDYAKKLAPPRAAACYADLDTSMIAGWLSHRIGSGSMRKKTARTYISLLNAWGEVLKDEGEIHVVPSVRGPKGSDAPQPGQRPYTPEEQARLIAVARADEASPEPRHKDRRAFAYTLLGCSGGRRRETSEVRVCDLAINDHPATVTFVGKNGRVDSVPLLPSAVEEARAWLAELEELNGAALSPTDPIFPPHPHPMKFPADRVLVSDMEAAGIPRVDRRHMSARWGSFRKGLATALVEAGVDQSHAQKILRHRTTEMTMNTYAKVRSGKMLESLMRTELAAPSAPREKNLTETAGRGADSRYSELASTSEPQMNDHHPNNSGLDAGTHLAEGPMCWQPSFVGVGALPRVPSVVGVSNAGGKIRPTPADSDLPAMPRGGLEPPIAFRADDRRADGGRGARGWDGKRVDHRVHYPDVAGSTPAPAVSCCGAPDAPSASSPGGDDAGSLPPQAGGVAHGAAGVDTPPPGLGRSVRPGPSFDDPATLAALERLERVGAASLLETPTMRRRVAVVISMALAGLVGAQPVGRGYQNGEQCGMGSGCFSFLPASLLDCLKCCSLNCNYSGFLQACQSACANGGGGGSEAPDSETVQARIVELVVGEAEKIRGGKLEPQALAESIDFVVAAATDADPHISLCASAIGEDIPLVRVRIHSEQGRHAQREVPGLDS